jgi:hypothetical protein
MPRPFEKSLSDSEQAEDSERAGGDMELPPADRPAVIATDSSDG